MTTCRDVMLIMASLARLHSEIADLREEVVALRIILRRIEEDGVMQLEVTVAESESESDTESAASNATAPF